MGNLLHGAAVGVELETTIADPRFKTDLGLFRPDSAGPATNVAVKCDTTVKKDMLGQLRPETGADIGAEEVSGATGEISSTPLSQDDVGVSFLNEVGSEKN